MPIERDRLEAELAELRETLADADDAGQRIRLRLSIQSRQAELAALQADQTSNKQFYPRPKWSEPQ